MLGKDLKLKPVTEALRTRGRGRLEGVLDPAQASRLAVELEGIRDWDIALTTAVGPVKISDAEWQDMNPSLRAKHQEMLRRQARSGFSFAYFRRDVLPDEEGRAVAGEFADFIQGQRFLQFARRLTGDSELVRADAHASLYKPGSFLKRHDDTYAGKERRFAYVLNLSRDWQADWGGLLCFEDAQGDVVETMVPRFNSLSVFRVPQHHHVSQVATYALRPRLAITGWFFA